MKHTIAKDKLVSLIEVLKRTRKSAEKGIEEQDVLVGIVGDLYLVIPELIAQIKPHLASHV